MTSFLIACIVLACMQGGTLLGAWLRGYLPKHHTSNDTWDIIKAAAGMLATLVALIIGLLVSSAKNSFDVTSTNITQGGAKIITLDRILARYGPEAKEIRDLLRQAVMTSLEHIWPTDTLKADMTWMETSPDMEIVYDKIRALAPRDEPQQYLKAQALQQSADLLYSRWMIVEQTQNALPPVLLILLIFWLTAFFTSFGLLAPRNVTAFLALFICAVSMAGSLYLILELNRPLEGVIKVSSEPMQKALSLIGK